jgi:hypothetical protein
MPLALPVEDWPLCQDGPLQAPVLKAPLIGMVNNPRHGLLLHQTLLFSAMLPRPAPPFKTGFARSKAKAMDPEIARNQNYDDHYANDSEDVHSAYSRSMMIVRRVLARLMYPSLLS